LYRVAQGELLGALNAIFHLVSEDETPLPGETPRATPSGWRLLSEGRGRAFPVVGHRLRPGRRARWRAARKPACCARRGSNCTRCAAGTSLPPPSARSGRPPRHLERLVTTDAFRHYTDAEIERYLQREPAFDCAGSAKSEALGISLIERLSGDDPTALVGLPLIALSEMLRLAGFEVP
jgi:septum formation protein